MTAPGTQDALGLSHTQPGTTLEFQVPTVPTGGTNRDVGTLALFLIANWFVNGETVLIDGGVSCLTYLWQTFSCTHHTRFRPFSSTLPHTESPSLFPNTLA